MAGNGPKHVDLTWNEFWSWKKLKNREKQISLAREREDFITIQNRRIVTTTVTQTCLADYKTFIMFTALETVVTFCAINVILQGKDILCIKIGNILNNLTHEYSLSIEHDVILKIEHVFEWWKKEKWIMPGFLFLWFSVSLGNYSLYILGLAEFQDNSFPENA